MDKTSKKIIHCLKEISEPKILFYFNDPYELLGINEDEFFRCVRYLASIGSIEYVSNQNGVHIGITLSHQSVHSKSIKWDSFKSWFLSSFAGGVVTGVCSTLLAELLLYLCAKLIGLL